MSSSNSRSTSPKQPLPRCTVCGYQTKRGGRRAGENDLWECSHVDCPHRHKVTAAPSDKAPKAPE